MTDSLKGRCFLVTGGAGAIGGGIGAAILDAGGYVVLVDLAADAAARRAKVLDPSQFRCVAKACDVTNAEQAHQAVAFAKAQFGRLDGLVNNAGIIKMNTAWEASVEEWRQHLDVNVTGAFIMAQAVGAHLREAGGGAIVNVSSNCGKVGYPNMAAYNASKAALINMTRSLAVEWAENDINVNAVCPGGVDTDMLRDVAQWLAPRLQVGADELLRDMGPAQMGRRIDPLEVGRVVAFLLSDHALIIRGQAINTDGGDTPY
jgi:NAD(P)-dependent dehydrogenase (short-subunit alcohol dehydrogenase family)